VAVPADAYAGELGPPLGRAGGEALAERGLGRLGRLGHITIVLQAAGLIMEAAAFRHRAGRRC
jgi:hypothetical protein